MIRSAYPGGSIPLMERVARILGLPALAVASARFIAWVRRDVDDELPF